MKDLYSLPVKEGQPVGVRHVLDGDPISATVMYRVKDIQDKEHYVNIILVHRDREDDIITLRFVRPSSLRMAGEDTETGEARKG